MNQTNAELARNALLFLNDELAEDAIHLFEQWGRGFLQDQTLQRRLDGAARRGTVSRVWLYEYLKQDSVYKAKLLFEYLREKTNGNQSAMVGASKELRGRIKDSGVFRPLLQMIRGTSLHEAACKLAAVQ